MAEKIDLTELSKEDLMDLFMNREAEWQGIIAAKDQQRQEEMEGMEGQIKILQEQRSSDLETFESDEHIDYGDHQAVVEFLKRGHSDIKSNLTIQQVQALASLSWRYNITHSPYIKGMYDSIIHHMRSHGGFSVDAAIRFIKGLSGVSDEERPEGRIKRMLKGSRGE